MLSAPTPLAAVKAISKVPVSNRGAREHAVGEAHACRQRAPLGDRGRGGAGGAHREGARGVVVEGRLVGRGDRRRRVHREREALRDEAGAVAGLKDDFEFAFLRRRAAQRVGAFVEFHAVWQRALHFDGRHRIAFVGHHEAAFVTLGERGAVARGDRRRFEHALAGRTRGFVVVGVAGVGGGYFIGARRTLVRRQARRDIGRALVQRPVGAPGDRSVAVHEGDRAGRGAGAGCDRGHSGGVGDRCAHHAIPFVGGAHRGRSSRPPAWWPRLR